MRAQVPAIIVRTTAIPQISRQAIRAFRAQRIKGLPLSVTYQGKPCKLGHTERYAIGNGCAVCIRARSAARYRADPLAHAAAGQSWAERNRGKSHAIKRAWEARNPGYVLGSKGYKDSRRRALKRAATCDCCAPALFRFLYWSAWEMGNEVDHRLPLAMGGKHCLHNLQVLTPEQHKAKTARDIAAIAAHKRDWLSAEDSPDWHKLTLSGDPEIDLEGIIVDVLKENPQLAYHFE